MDRGRWKLSQLSRLCRLTGAVTAVGGAKRIAAGGLDELGWRGGHLGFKDGVRGDRMEFGLRTYIVRGLLGRDTRAADAEERGEPGKAAAMVAASGGIAFVRVVFTVSIVFTVSMRNAVRMGIGVAVAAGEVRAAAAGRRQHGECEE